MNSLEKAIEIAESVHTNQTDKKGYPYMAHIIDVVSRVSDFGKSYEIVAMLHDAVEDAEPKSFRKSIRNQIKEHFSTEISEAILAITKNKDEDYFSDYLPRVKNNRLALKVKIADSSHNLSKVYLLDEDTLRLRFRKKYVKVLNYLGVNGDDCEKPIIFDGQKWISKGQ